MLVSEEKGKRKRNEFPKDYFGARRSILFLFSAIPTP